jgi:hypothetical protein
MIIYILWLHDIAALRTHHIVGRKDQGGAVVLHHGRTDAMPRHQTWCSPSKCLDYLVPHHHHHSRPNAEAPQIPATAYTDDLHEHNLNKC